MPSIISFRFPRHAMHVGLQGGTDLHFCSPNHKLATLQDKG